MKHRIRNIGKARRGVEKADGRYAWLEPGDERTIEVASIRGVESDPSLEVELVGDVGKPPESLVEKVAKAAPRARLPQLDHDKDGDPGGSTKQTSDDIPALRAEYQRILGKRPFNGWDADTLREKIAAASK